MQDFVVVVVAKKSMVLPNFKLQALEICSCYKK